MINMKTQKSIWFITEAEDCAITIVEGLFENGEDCIKLVNKDQHFEMTFTITEWEEFIKICESLI